MTATLHGNCSVNSIIFQLLDTRIDKVLLYLNPSHNQDLLQLDSQPKRK